MRVILLSALTVLAFPASQLQAVGLFDIRINPGPGLASNPEALSAFERAAAEWEAWISTPITIYIDADLSTSMLGFPFDPDVIGATSYTSYDITGNLNDLNLDYTLVRNAMAARANRPGNELLAYLPTSDQVSAIVPDGASLDNTTMGVLRANQRALGLLDASDTRADAVIVFNEAFTFDFNRFDANGVGATMTDFQTAAAHEIGHALGFLSDVEDFDNYPYITSTNLTPLDLFRFPTAQRPKTLLEFQTFSRVLKPGEPSTLVDLTNEYPMSTGANFGDGNQSGHWRDDYLVDPQGNIFIGSLVGIMDPTLPAGTWEEVSASDIRAMNLIGYDVVPEPSTAALMAVGTLALFGRARSRRRKHSA